MSIKKSIKINDIFNHWKVVETSSSRKNHLICKCIGCEESTREIHYIDLFYGKTKSCGCKKKELTHKTNLEKYGVLHATQLPEAIGKRCKTNLKKYGTKHASQNSTVKEKRRSTFIENYGVDNPRKSNRVKERIKQTFQNRYNVDNYAQTKEYKEKAKQTSLEKYGVEFFSQTQDFITKVKEVNLKRYGVDNYAQLPENRNKLKQWCEKNPGSNGTSKAELEMFDFVRQYYPNAKKLKIKGHELDVFIPELNLGIEHNGLWWHSEANKPNNYHLSKTKFFTSLNIRTIHIWEHEWLKRQDQVESFLLSALEKNEHKIGARKCKIVWSSLKEEIQKAHKLLDSTHIQGYSNSTKYVANVYFEDQLLATATFGKHHRNSKEWALTRFTTKANYTVQGILSRISRLASKELRSDIISWADYRLSEGNGYIKAKWIKEELSYPDYFYVKGLRIISKQSRQKKLMKTPVEMTESEHAKIDGLLRIYDCGKIRFRLKYIGNDN